MKKKLSHVYWFAPYNLNCPSTRYRGKIPLEYLNKNYDITFDFVFPERTWKGVFKFILIFLKALMDFSPHSIIVIQKVCTARLYAFLLKWLIRLKQKTTVYDIDDAEHLRNSTENLHFFLKNCNKISTGSTALQAYVSNYNTQTFVLTSPVPNHCHIKTKRNPFLWVGWVGDFGNGNEISSPFSHKTALYRLFFPALISIEIPIRLTLIGVKTPSDIPEIKCFFKDFPHVELDLPENLYWENDSWLYPSIANFDIGISPMIDHPFNHAKSAFKAKQYLSCGVPVLASPVGENKKFVTHGFNGFWCEGVDDFSKYLLHLTQLNDSKYFQLCQNALLGRNDYSLKRNAALFLQNVI